MEILDLDGKSYSLNSLGIDLAFFQHDDDLYINIKEYSDGDLITEEKFAFIDVTSVSNKLLAQAPLEIKDESNDSLGYLVIGDGKTRSITDLPSIHIAASLYFLLTDQINNGTSKEDVNPPVDFESSMIVEDRSVLLISENRLQNYKETYMTGSDLWGGFSHRQMDSVEHDEITSLEAVPNISLPTDAHKNKAYYSTSSDNSFTRFLSKYQIIELMFDYITVAKLRVSKDDLFEFRDIMNEYDREDIRMLKSVLKNYVLDISQLSESMYKFSEFKDTTKLIFQKHSKDSNPIKKEANFNQFWEALERKKLTYIDLNANPELKFLTLPKPEKGGEAVFAIALKNIVSYWIYRIRCSIAHNKIGEHIFTDTDEPFIVDAAEPLLDEVLRQLLTNTELQELLKKSQQLENTLVS